MPLPLTRSRFLSRLAVIFTVLPLAISCTTIQKEQAIKVSSDLNNQGFLLRQKGNNKEALEYHEKALALRERYLGPEDPLVATSLYDLGVAHFHLGNYDEAEVYYRRALEIRQKTLPADHLEVAGSLIRLADLYRNLGDYEKAEPLYKRALAIREKRLGPDHPDVAWSLASLAILYTRTKDYATAEVLLNRALDIRERKLGKNHWDVGMTLSFLSPVYLAKGDYDKAVSAAERSVDLLQQQFGPDHPWVADRMTTLARAYMAGKDYEAAKVEFNKALAIYQGRYGEIHPVIANNLMNQAILCAKQGEFDEALSLGSKAQNINQVFIQKIMMFTSERQKIIFLSQPIFLLPLDVYLSIVHQYSRDNPSAQEEAFNAWLKRKGVALEAQKRFQQTLIDLDTPDAAQVFEELIEVRGQLSGLIFAGDGGGDPNTYRDKYNALMKKRDDLELKLIQRSRGFAAHQNMENASSESVAMKLPSQTVLIDIAKVRMFDFQETRPGKPHYFAFIIRSGNKGDVAMLDLGSAVEIDRTVSVYRSAIKDPLKSSMMSRQIYTKVFEPIKAQLGDVREIFVSPDGKLNLIPFEILQDPNGRFLIEDYTFNYINAGRELIGFGEKREKGGKALLMGDPDFEWQSEEPDGRTVKGTFVYSKKQRQETTESSELRGLHFTNLPWTREEVIAIHELLGKENADSYVGREATEEILLQRESPSMLHLATHGFFLSEEENLSLEGGIFDKEFETIPLATKGAAPTGGIKIKNPLLRSGIVLAGANKVIKSGNVEKSDGIVTAEKILGLRLRGTDLVVLSACETGVGVAERGEGIFGLRRAFTQAGARSMVMSMWSVPDRETKELMLELYNNILSRKMNRCQALRQAALKQMALTKQRYGIPHPFYWGGFVFLGEP